MWLQQVVRGTTAAVLSAALVTAAGSSVSATSSNSGKGVVLTAEGDGTTPPDNFNPYLPTSADNEIAFTGLIYEPLLQFNLLKPNAITPWLASSWAWSNGDRTLTFQLRKGVKWSNGQPFTSADVVETFDILKKYPSLNTSGITFNTITATSPDTVTITFAKPSFPEFYYIAGTTYIVPKATWASVNPVTYMDKDPIGTGPYVLKSFSGEDIVVARNPNYWQKEPVVSQISFPTASVTTDEALLSEGKMDWADGAFPNIKTIFANKSKYNVYWFPPGGLVDLVPNLTVSPLDNVDVRKALSLAVDRDEISTVGEYGYEAPATSPTGLVLPDDASLMAPQYKSLHLTQNDSKAMSLLEAAGFKKGPNGFFEKNGKEISLTLTDPSNFPDYMEDDQIMETEFAKIGIKITVHGVSVNAWAADLDSGHFDLSTDYSNVGPSPYYWYDGLLDNKLSAPIGKTASGDFERWSDPKTQTLLSDYVTGTTTAARDNAIQGIEGIMVNDMPVIPLVYSAYWGEYRTNQLVGWPSAKNPYQIPFTGPGMAVIMLHVRLRRSGSR